MPRKWQGSKKGIVHIIRVEDPAKTQCGIKLEFFPGQEVEDDKVTCVGCARSFDAKADRDELWARWEQERQAQIQQDAEQKQEEREEYKRYLLSPQWQEKRVAVFRRASGICEACRKARAVQIHHLTYKHIYNEPLFDLAAVCLECHKAITAMDRAARGIYDS